MILTESVIMHFFIPQSIKVLKLSAATTREQVCKIIVNVPSRKFVYVNSEASGFDAGAQVQLFGSHFAIRLH